MCVSRSRTAYVLFGGFSFNNVHFVNPVDETDKFRYIDFPTIVNTSFLQHFQIRVRCPGHVNAPSHRILVQN